MAILTFQLEEEQRLTIGLVASVLSLLCVFPSIVLFAVGIYIQVYDQTKVIFVEDLDTSVLPAFLIVFGILCIIDNYAVGALLFLSRRELKRESISSFLFPLVIFGLVLSLLVMLVGILCFVQISQLSNSFEKGITSAMSRYNKDVSIKKEMDILQIDFACCGNADYTDWFHTSWTHVGNMTRRATLQNDNVPFSCCNPDAGRPCIHDHVDNDQRHFNYDHKTDNTLHLTGCREALTDLYGTNMFTKVGALAISISLIQLIAVGLTRLVQTSFAKAEEKGEMLDTAPGYIFGAPDDNDDDDDGETDALLEEMSDDFTDSTFDEEPVYENIDDMRVELANNENGNSKMYDSEARSYYVTETPTKRSDRIIRNRTSLVSRNNGEELTSYVPRRQSLPKDSVASFTNSTGRVCRSMSSLDHFYSRIDSTDMVHQDVRHAKHLYDNAVPSIDNLPIPTGSYTTQNYCPNQHGLPAKLGSSSRSFQEQLNLRPEVEPLKQVPAIPEFPESMHTLSSSGLFFQTSPRLADNEDRTRTRPNMGGILSGDHVYESIHKMTSRSTHTTNEVQSQRSNPYISDTTSTGKDGIMVKNISPTRNDKVYMKSPSQEEIKARVPRRLPSLPKDSVTWYTNHKEHIGGTIPSKDNFNSYISSKDVLPTEHIHDTMPSTDSIYETPMPMVSTVGNLPIPPSSFTTQNGQSQQLLPNRPTSVPLSKPPERRPKLRSEMETLMQPPVTPEFPEITHTLTSEGGCFHNTPADERIAVKRSVSFYR